MSANPLKRAFIVHGTKKPLLHPLSRATSTHFTFKVSSSAAIATCWLSCLGHFRRSSRMTAWCLFIYSTISMPTHTRPSRSLMPLVIYKPVPGPAHSYCNITSNIFHAGGKFSFSCLSYWWRLETSGVRNENQAARAHHFDMPPLDWSKRMVAWVSGRSTGKCHGPVPQLLVFQCGPTTLLCPLLLARWSYFWQGDQAQKRKKMNSAPAKARGGQRLSRMSCPLDQNRGCSRTV